jgi:hypothetical protein
MSAFSKLSIAAALVAMAFCWWPPSAESAPAQTKAECVDDCIKNSLFSVCFKKKKDPQSGKMLYTLDDPDVLSHPWCNDNQFRLLSMIRTCRVRCNVE